MSKFEKRTIAYFIIGLLIGLLHFGGRMEGTMAEPTLQDWRDALMSVAMFPVGDYRGPCWCPDLLRHQITEGTSLDGKRRAEHTPKCKRISRMYTEPGGET